MHGLRRHSPELFLSRSALQSPRKNTNVGVVHLVFPYFPYELASFAKYLFGYTTSQSKICQSRNEYWFPHLPRTIGKGCCLHEKRLLYITNDSFSLGGSCKRLLPLKERQPIVKLWNMTKHQPRGSPRVIAIHTIQSVQARAMDVYGSKEGCPTRTSSQNPSRFLSRGA